VAAELQRALGAGSGKTVYLAGGIDALSQSYELALANMGFKTVRFDGINRNDTAGLIGNDIAARNPSPATTVILGENRAFADVLGLGSIPTIVQSGGVFTPIILTERGIATLDPFAERYLDSHPATTVLIVGGTAAVHESIPIALQQRYPGLVIDRVAGRDRFATNVDLNRRYFPNPLAAVLVSGSSQALPGSITPSAVSAAGFQALLAGTIAAHNAATPIILTSGANITASVLQYLQEIAGKPNTAYIVGYPPADTAVIQTDIQPYL
jgi:putative cell wall-binding protein